MTQADTTYRNELIEMTEQAGMHYRRSEDEFCKANTDGVPMEMLEAFATLVVDAATKKEREACAKFIEEGYVRQFYQPWRKDLAAAIRARSEE
jgi:hypothetical protein